MNLSQNLLKLCEERDLTLTDLSRLSGVKQPTLHGWSTGRAVHNLDDLKKVADVLAVSIHRLLYGTPDPHESISDEVLKEVFKGDVRITIHKIERPKE